MTTLFQEVTDTVSGETGSIFAQAADENGRIPNLYRISLSGSGAGRLYCSLHGRIFRSVCPECELKPCQE